MLLFYGGLAILAMVFSACYVLQRRLSIRSERDVASKLRQQRMLHSEDASRNGLNLGVEVGFAPHGASDESVSEQMLRVGGQAILAFSWSAEREYWDGRAATIRRSFLARTQETAEKWRTIFAGLLAVFGAVLVVNKPDMHTSALPWFVSWLVVVALILGLHAVGYTGWAAAGLPKMLVDVNAETAFEAETRQACRSLTRLKIGLMCGAATAVLLTLALAAVIA